MNRSQLTAPSLPYAKLELTLEERNAIPGLWVESQQGRKINTNLVSATLFNDGKIYAPFDLI